MKAPKTILVPTDLSAYSLSALQYAVEIAKLFEAKITVLHVCESKKPSTKKSGGIQKKDSRSKEVKNIREQLSRLLVNYNVVAQSLQIFIKHGSPVREIIHTSRDLPADLIVMSTHGRTGLHHVLMGSVAEKVVRYSTCPVLTIKPEEFRELIDITEEDIADSLHTAI